MSALVAKGASFSSRNGDGKTPIDLANENGHSSVVALLNVYEMMVRVYCLNGCPLVFWGGGESGEGTKRSAPTALHRSASHPPLPFPRVHLQALHEGSDDEDDDLVAFGAGSVFEELDRLRTDQGTASTSAAAVDTDGSSSGADDPSDEQPLLTEV